MALTLLEISSGGRSKVVRVQGERVIIGASSECHVQLPFTCIRSRHLEVVADAGLVRVRTCEADAPATINQKQVASEWRLLPQGQPVCLPSPDGATLHIRIYCHSEVGSGVVVEEADVPVVNTSSHGVRPEVVGVSAIDETQTLFTVQPPSAVTPREPRRSPLSEHNRFLVYAICLLVMVVLAIGAAMLKDGFRRRATASAIQEIETIDSQIDRSLEQIRVGQYVAARQLLDDTAKLVESAGRTPEYGKRIEAILNRPEIRFGANGYQKLDGKWHPADMVMSERAARERNAPKIAELQTQAQNAAAVRQFERARQYCDDALMLLASQPIQPAAGAETFTKLRVELQNRLVADDMKAKGFVLVDDRWVTPAEKYRLDQTALGMVEYRGKWMPKEEAFAAEQADKGLVFHQGKWLTAEQKLEVDGFVLFEGKWIKTEEHAAILAERERIAKAERVRIEVERQQLEQAALERTQQGQRLETLKRDAYGMSQTVLRRDKGFGGQRATFPPFEDPAVVILHDNGWFMVRAYVDVHGALGAMTRRIYICRLRPSGAGDWESDVAEFLGGPP